VRRSARTAQDGDVYATKLRKKFFDTGARLWWTRQDVRRMNGLAQPLLDDDAVAALLKCWAAERKQMKRVTQAWQTLAGAGMMEACPTGDVERRGLNRHLQICEDEPMPENTADVFDSQLAPNQSTKAQTDLQKCNLPTKSRQASVVFSSEGNQARHNRRVVGSQEGCLPRAPASPLIRDLRSPSPGPYMEMDEEIRALGLPEQTLPSASSIWSECGCELDWSRVSG
jgi:hypothetical protein